MGGGLVGKLEDPAHTTPGGDCPVCNNNLMRICNVQLFLMGRMWSVQGYVLCPKCKVIYKVKPNAVEDKGTDV